MKLTTAQLLELRRHRIHAHEVFDARGMTLSAAKAAMATHKEEVMVNGLPCPNDPTHVLRSRYGKCVECNPATLAMQRRKRRAASVYLLGSASKSLVKVGMSVDHDERLRRLNFYGYGGCRDWRFIAVARSGDAGKLETELHRALATHKVEVTYVKDSQEQVCRELFDCPPSTALREFESCARVSNATMLKRVGQI